jgi:hypothetical protein
MPKRSFYINYIILQSLCQNDNFSVFSSEGENEKKDLTGIVTFLNANELLMWKVLHLSITSKVVYLLDGISFA